MFSQMASFDKNDSLGIKSGSESITRLSVLSEGSFLSESLFKSIRLMLTSDEYTGVANVSPKLYPRESCEIIYDSKSPAFSDILGSELRKG